MKNYLIYLNGTRVSMQIAIIQDKIITLRDFD